MPSTANRMFHHDFKALGDNIIPDWNLRPLISRLKTSDINGFLPPWLYVAFEIGANKKGKDVVCV